jgi:hypothetical protein
MRIGGLSHGLDDESTVEEVEEAEERIGEIRNGFADALVGLGTMLRDAPGHRASSRFYLGGITLGLTAVTKALIEHSMPIESELIAASNLAISRRKTGEKKRRK